MNSETSEESASSMKRGEGTPLRPRAVLRRQEAAENSHKGTAALPSPCQGCGLLSAYSTAALSGLQLARIFGEQRLPPTNQPDQPPPLHSHGCAEQVPLVSSLEQWHFGWSRTRHLPAALGWRAAPRPQRALPATLRRGAGPDTAALGPPGRPEPATASPPPPLARAVASLIWDTGQVEGLRQPIRWQSRAGGGPTAPAPARPVPLTHPAPRPTQRALRGTQRLRTPEVLTDKRLTPTNRRHLCFHARREEKRPISDEA
ncbi:uncharacterized protein LOC115067908 [Nannospalax galili]|uniref:uncharacterized protein LOC115067908 n=1 Tax=Nannospalax galili TaxID=1026970 RepID=UPI00111BE6FE|nr:uncharacterized protein LOC115067908 [Nannospalax galili]